LPIWRTEYRQPLAPIIDLDRWLETFSNGTAMKLTSSERVVSLNQSRTLKMARSTHAYVRGNTVEFYRWLAESKASKKLPSGPQIWICGDCHLGNLGPVADIDGNVDVQIRDLDQTVIGNPSHDLIRLGLSLATAARGSDLPGVTTARMMEEMVKGYTLAMTESGERAPEPNVVRSVRRRSLGRRWRHLADERLEEVTPALPLGKKFWPLELDERAALDAVFEQPEVHRTVLSLNARNDDDRVRLVDAAYWKKGCSSLGNLRFAALLAIGGSRKEPDAYALIDLKEAAPAAAPSVNPRKMPRDAAERVVAGAKALSPNLGARMVATTLLGKPMVLRELLPQDLKLEVDQFTRAEATRAARYLAYIVGLAHARQMDAATRADWAKAIAPRPGAMIDAPGWLWESIVDLVASHEAGYLEHCRKYALSQAA